MSNEAIEQPLIFKNAVMAFSRYWLTVLVSSILFTAMAASYAIVAKPVFLAEVTMIAMDDKDSMSSSMPSGLATIAAGAGLNMQSNYLRIVSMATLQSQMFMKSFINNAELLPILFPDDWDDERRIWTAEKPTLNDAYELFTDEIMSVSQDFQTGLTTVGIRWHDPDVAADWSNSLVDTLNREMQQRAIDEAGESIAYLKKELEATSVLGVQQAIHDLIETQLNRQMRANVRSEYAFRVIDPASAPDKDDPVFPRFAVLLIAGALLGFMLGIAIAVVRDFSASADGQYKSEK